VTGNKAIALIRDCADNDRVEIKDHFRQRMGERGMFWPDVLGVVHGKPSLRADGVDRFGRERWFLAADAPDGWPIELLCVIDDDGPTAAMITIYWD